VLGVQLGGERSAGQRAVKPFLEPPGRVVAVTVEADFEARMTEHVVHGAEPVVCAADLASHGGMWSVTVSGRARDLQNAVAPHRADQLVGIAVRTLRHGEDDVHRRWPPW
jgi:hypothetical protein